MGLRESKKQQTREHIAAEAMRLFVTRGFDHVTVAEVAEAAGVSEKTVFNYFPTKEDLFFDEVPARLGALTAAVRERASAASVFAALRESQSRSINRISSPQFVHFARTLEESAALRAKELEVMSEFASALADALHAELQIDELDARVAANALVGVHSNLFRRARSEALAGHTGPGTARKLRRELERSYALLEHGLSALES